MPEVNGGGNAPKEAGSEAGAPEKGAGSGLLVVVDEVESPSPWGWTLVAVETPDTAPLVVTGTIEVTVPVLPVLTIAVEEVSTSEVTGLLAEERRAANSANLS